MANKGENVNVNPTAKGGNNPPPTAPKSKFAPQPTKVNDVDDINSLTNDDLLSFMSMTIGSLTEQDIADIAGVFAFQGFDPAIIIKAFFTNGKDAGKSMDIMRQDISKILIIYLTRGTAIGGKITTRSTVEAKKQLQELVTAYKIQSTKKENTASSYAPTTLTLARLGSAFAMLTSQIMNSPAIERVVGERPTGLYKGLCWPGGASIIPKSTEFNAVYELWIVWATSFDKVINSNNKSHITDVANIRKYGDIMRNNAFYSESIRAKTTQFFASSAI